MVCGQPFQVEDASEPELVAECPGCSFRFQPNHVSLLDRIATFGWLGGVALLILGLLIGLLGPRVGIPLADPIGFNIAGAGGISVLVSKLVFGISYLRTPKPK